MNGMNEEEKAFKQAMEAIFYVRGWTESPPQNLLILEKSLPLQNCGEGKERDPGLRYY